MESRKLQHFLAVCEQGSMQRAAEHCHLTQSALSRSLAALAQELGVPLFDGGKRRLQPSRFGLALLAKAQRLLDEERELKRELALMNAGLAGDCAIGFSPTPAELGMAHCLAWLADQAPQVRARMAVGRTDALLEDLRRHVLDLAVVDASAIRDTDGLSMELLPPLEGGFVCRAQHPLSALPRPSLADLRPYAVACSPLSEAFEREISQSLGKLQPSSHWPSLQADNYQALKSATLASDMVLLVAHAVVRAELDDGRLIALPRHALPTPVGRYALVRTTHRVQLPVMASLCDVLRQRLAQA
ncbi:LysR family transcriptional regulator [Curvibacter lanceolatus]|uniref:LysR family transcriptional regulator n=1 Tax=Curvibacter lanceolatus TaxID=86182 RepID=UPI0003825D64|nr:LysR family transcriptional regulator [Curvibacter lanceolatus]